MELLDDSIDFSAYLKETDAAAKVKPASSYRQELKDRLRVNRDTRKIYLPWLKTRESFDFREGELTVWAGYNGHGKSLVTSQVCLGLMAQGQKVVIASFEMKPHTTMQRLARMFAGTNPFSAEYQSQDGIAAIDELYDEFCNWTTDRLWLYDHVGSVDGNLVIGMARYCAKEIGIKHIVIDNLAKCIKDEDDYNGQKRFVDELMAIAQDYNVHIHVVHHLKKPAKETDKPDKADVKGSGSVVDQPDNLFLVWRNKLKEEDRKSGADKRKDEPDQMLYCRKQRNYGGSGDGEPSIALWYHADAGHFVADKNDQPMSFTRFGGSFSAPGSDGNF